MARLSHHSIFAKPVQYRRMSNLRTSAKESMPLTRPPQQDVVTAGAALTGPCALGAGVLSTYGVFKCS